MSDAIVTVSQADAQAAILGELTQKPLNHV